MGTTNRVRTQPSGWGGANARELKVEPRLIASLKPNPRNARTHSKKQIRQIAESIRVFGFTNPVLIDSDGAILAGHGRVAAARGRPSSSRPS